WNEIFSKLNEVQIGNVSPCKPAECQCAAVRGNGWASIVALLGWRGQPCFLTALHGQQKQGVWFAGRGRVRDSQPFAIWKPSEERAVIRTKWIALVDLGKFALTTSNGWN